jgi:hypothetical protein
MSEEKKSKEMTKEELSKGKKQLASVPSDQDFKERLSCKQ